MSVFHFCPLTMCKNSFESRDKTTDITAKKKIMDQSKDPKKLSIFQKSNNTWKQTGFELLQVKVSIDSANNKMRKKCFFFYYNIIV